MSSLRISKIIAVFALVAFLFPASANAENLRLKNARAVAKAQQPVVVQLDQEALADLLAIQNDCGRCHANVSGVWRYTLLKRNIPQFNENIRLVQSGLSFKGVAPMYTIVGSARGKTLNFTMVVTGEEGEGFVRKVDASIDGRRITGVYLDSDGEVGSFVAFRP